ncbi:hypothetical protein M514_17229 [Trichuris suis]|uniref:Uncharacterized protein n=1 Tax=Trichuris suis TaxID=68888 RepID=A0A085NMR1_9BILA|nr:hypothetical protein M514_17229 [Trichuris suis]
MKNDQWRRNSMHNAINRLQGLVRWHQKVSKWKEKVSHKTMTNGILLYESYPLVYSFGKGVTGDRNADNSGMSSDDSGKDIAELLRPFCTHHILRLAISNICRLWCAKCTQGHPAIY